MYFYKNAALRVGLPNVRLHTTAPTAILGQTYYAVPFTIISNHSTTDIDNQTVKVSTLNQNFSGYLNSHIVIMTFSFNNSDTLDWMLISEVMMFTDTGECNM